MTHQKFTKLADKLWLGVAFFHLEAKGASGGLATMWNPSVLMGTEVHKEKNFMVTKFSNDKMVWNLVNIYVPNTRVGRSEVWETVGR